MIGRPVLVCNNRSSFNQPGGVLSLRKVYVTLIFSLLFAIYWFGHTHLVYSASYTPSELVFGNVLADQSTHIRGISSIYDFNHWLGWNASFQRPVTWNAWLGMLCLQYDPNKVLGYVLFVIPFWIKIIIFLSIYWFVVKWVPNRRRSDQGKHSNRKDQRTTKTQHIVWETNGSKLEF